MDRLPPIPAPGAEDYGRVPAPVDWGEPLVDLAHVAPEIGYAAVYFRAGRPGGMERCLLRETVVQKLKQVAAALPEGYTLLVYDGLRPLSVQRSLYEDCKAAMRAAHPELGEGALADLVADYVAYPCADPARPAPHTTGGAVDLTLCRDGVPLDMGTDFDDATPRAWVDDLERHPKNPAARDNRRLLYHAMVGAGFASYRCEWWHFSYGERLWAMETGHIPLYGFRKECEERE